LSVEKGESRDLDKPYADEVQTFDEAVSDALSVSGAATGRPLEGKIWWTCVFSRLCVISVPLNNPLIALPPTRQF
jgi:hypothetical protein